jgi:haloalkane dehalogenase
MHYIDEGKGDVILFVHGTPSWSFDFRKIILHFKDRFRCIAVDHIGFGLSDKPQHYPYKTGQHAENLEAFVQHLNLSNITLVLHDFGGPIGMQFATKYPEKIKQVVVLNSWLWNTENEAEFRKMKGILRSPLLPFLYLNLNFSARFLMPGSFGNHKLSARFRKQYTSPFRHRADRYGTLGFAKSLISDQNYFQSLWNSCDSLQNKNFLIIWGMADKFLTPTYLRKWQSRFPSAKTVELQGCGHFPQEEIPDKVNDAISNWMGN